MSTPKSVAAVIPCYKVKRHILAVIKAIGPEVAKIYVVDDCCPDGSGEFVQKNCSDPRVEVLRHEKNQGVGGAVVTGYRKAIQDQMGIVVKIDGDGQMDPSLVHRFVNPILQGKADYTKGNRFNDIESLGQMPVVRLFGNSVLSFVSKLASGYWTVMDPTNGYTALQVQVLALLPLDKLEKRYFFESDMLFRLNTVRAVVLDVPMAAKYGDEISNLNIRRIILTFPTKFLKRFLKRLTYNYFLRDFNAASLELVVGGAFLLFGCIYGGVHWAHSYSSGIAASTGVIILAALPVILGVQLLVSALGYDIENTPRTPLHPLLD